LCPYKCVDKGDLNKHIAVVHEKKRPFLCSLCTYKSGQKKDLTKHIAGAHEKKKTFGLFHMYQFSENQD
jgi:hypothetical protein